MVFIIITIAFTESIFTDAKGSLANKEFCISRHCAQVMISNSANIQQAIWLVIVPRRTKKSAAIDTIFITTYNLYIVRYLNVLQLPTTRKGHIANILNRISNNDRCQLLAIGKSFTFKNLDRIRYYHIH